MNRTIKAEITPEMIPLNVEEMKSITKNEYTKK